MVEGSTPPGLGCRLCLQPQPQRGQALPSAVGAGGGDIDIEPPGLLSNAADLGAPLPPPGMVVPGTQEVQRSHVCGDSEAASRHFWDRAGGC